MGLIDATWRCSQFCGQQPTGYMSSSITRSQAWRQRAQKYPRHDRRESLLRGTSTASEVKYGRRIVITVQLVW